MTDQPDSRPLTRRERRLLDMPETGQVPVVDASGAQGEAVSTADDVVISPYDESGRPRTRRELRELREQKLAELGLSASSAQDTEQFEQVMSTAQRSTEAEVAPQDEPVEPPALPVAPESVPEVPDLDPRLAATQGFTPQELEEIAEPAESASAQPDARQPAVEAEATSALVPEAAEEVTGESGAGTEAETSGANPEPPETIEYSFPDIAPLDDAQSVFDDPTVRTMATPVAPRSDAGGDFDDLISRAVAQEGAASATNTSALILPNMPDDGGLAGPLGETGELYITGSIDLPRSLGETGGHSSLHDSVDAEPLEELGFDLGPAVTNDLTQPVSAVKAVSARAHVGPVVTETHKEKSKLPLVLISTGGGLLLGLAALVVWAAVSGMFG